MMKYYITKNNLIKTQKQLRIDTLNKAAILAHLKRVKEEGLNKGAK